MQVQTSGSRNGHRYGSVTANVNGFFPGQGAAWGLQQPACPPEHHGITPLRGFRSWLADGDQLYSPQQRSSWEGGVAQAVCNAWRLFFGERANRHSPGLHCQCGIYAYRDPRSLAHDQWTQEGEQVFGEVDLWGKVIEAEHGYRGEHARVVSLYDTGVTAARAAERLQVPLVSPEGLAIAKPRSEARLSMDSAIALPPAHR